MVEHAPPPTEDPDAALKPPQFTLRTLLVAMTALACLFAVMTAWLMVCFTAMTFHMAPLSQEFMSGALQPDKDHAVLLGTAPDQQWLGFARYITGKGSFSRGSSNGFDPNKKFVVRYGERLFRFEQTEKFRVKR